jgi:hypothetical protein
VAEREMVVLNSNDADNGSVCVCGLMMMPLLIVGQGWRLQILFFLFCLLILSYYKLFDKIGLVKVDLEDADKEVFMKVSLGM